MVSNKNRRPSKPQPPQNALTAPRVLQGPGGHVKPHTNSNQNNEQKEVCTTPARPWEDTMSAGRANPGKQTLQWPSVPKSYLELPYANIEVQNATRTRSDKHGLDTVASIQPDPKRSKDESGLVSHGTSNGYADVKRNEFPNSRPRSSETNNEDQNSRFSEPTSSSHDNGRQNGGQSQTDGGPSQGMDDRMHDRRISYPWTPSDRLTPTESLNSYVDDLPLSNLDIERHSRGPKRNLTRSDDINHASPPSGNINRTSSTGHENALHIDITTSTIPQSAVLLPILMPEVNFCQEQEHIHEHTPEAQSQLFLDRTGVFDCVQDDTPDEIPDEISDESNLGPESLTPRWKTLSERQRLQYHLTRIGLYSYDQAEELAIWKLDPPDRRRVVRHIEEIESRRLSTLNLSGIPRDTLSQMFPADEPLGGAILVAAVPVHLRRQVFNLSGDGYSPITERQERPSHDLVAYIREKKLGKRPQGVLPDGIQENGNTVLGSRAQTLQQTPRRRTGQVIGVQRNRAGGSVQSWPSNGVQNQGNHYPGREARRVAESGTQRNMASGTSSCSRATATRSFAERNALTGNPEASGSASGHFAQARSSHGELVATGALGMGSSSTGSTTATTPRSVSERHGSSNDLEITGPHATNLARRLVLEERGERSMVRGMGNGHSSG